MGQKYDVVAEFSVIFEQNRHKAVILSREVSALLWNKYEPDLMVPKIINGRVLRTENASDGNWVTIVTEDDSIFVVNRNSVVALS